MSRIYIIPTNLDIRPPVQNYVQNTDNLLGIKEVLPFENSFAQFIETEELDHFKGMTAAHLMGNDPKVDVRPGSKKFKYEPLAFKETDVLNEADILRARKIGTYGQQINLAEEIAKIAKRRAQKTMIRVETTVWQCVGGALAFDENGVKVNETWAGVQSHTPTANWDDLDDSTPLLDLDTAADKFDGTGASMEGAVIYGNRQTWRYMMQNQNDEDLMALDRTQWGNFRFMFSQLAKIVQDKCGAVIKSYDEGYYAAGGTFTKFLPTGQIRIIGKRSDGENVGKWWSTPSLHNTDAAGNEMPGYFVVVEANGHPSTGSVSDLGGHKNPKIEVTGGIYGGPNLDYENNIIKMTVKA